MKILKKDFQCILMVILLLVFLTPSLSVSAKTSDVTSSGVTKDSFSSAAKNLTNLNKIISSATSGSEIYFPAGTYYISGYITLNGKSNITLRGDDATIINTAYTPYTKDSGSYMNSRIIDFYNCTNVTVEGLNFDYYYHTSASGVITSYSGGYTYVKLYDEYYKSEDKPKLIGGEFAQTINIIGHDDAPLAEFWCSNASTGYTTVMSDAKNGIYGINTWAGAVGDRVVIRFTLGSYASPAFIFQKNNGINIKNCNVYSCPSATFYALPGNSNFNFDGLNIAPKPGSQAIWSSNVDGIHIKGLRGTLNLKNSSFVGMGDDSLNVHSRAGKIKSIDASNNKIVLSDPYENNNLSGDWGKIGDVLEFYNTGFTSLGKATVKNYLNGTVTLDSLPSGLAVGNFVANMELMPSVTIDNCHVSNSRARAFLIQTKNVEIKNCTLENLRLAAIIVAPDITQWYEMGPSDNVNIHNNTIKNVCALKNNSSNYGAIMVRTRHDAGGTNASAGVHKNMRIDDNNFIKIGAPCIYAASVSTLDITNNVFIDYGRNSVYASTFGQKAIALFNSNDVYVSSNNNDDIYTSSVNYRAQEGLTNSLATTIDHCRTIYFDDNFKNSLSDDRIVKSTEQKYSGSASAQAVFPSNGTSIELKSTGDAIDMSDYWDMGYLSMYVKSNAASNFKICLTNGDALYKSSYITVNTTTEWAYVKIPLSSFFVNNINSSGIFKTNEVTGFVLSNSSTNSLDKTFYIDDIEVHEVKPSRIKTTLYNNIGNTTDNIIDGSSKLEADINAEIENPFFITVAIYNSNGNTLNKVLCKSFDSALDTASYLFDLGSMEADDSYIKIMVWDKDNIKPVFKPLNFTR